MIKKLYWYLFVYDLNATAAIPAARSGVSIKQKFLKDLSWLMLFAYGLLTFNTAIPVIGDVLAHTFWKQQHLASEHKLHGKNHVALEISKAEKSEGQTNSHAKTNTEDFTHILCSAIIITHPIQKVMVRVYSSLPLHFSFMRPSLDDPPPR